MADRADVTTLVERDVATLLARLADPQPARQYEAFLELCERRTDGDLSRVMAGFEAAPPGTREQIIRYLARVATSAAQEALVGLVLAPDHPQAAAARAALERIPPRRRVDALLALLARGADDTRRRAVVELGRAHHAKTVLPLMAAYAQAPGALRVDILGALERIRDPRALALARKALSARIPSSSGDEPEVIGQALRLLRHLGGRRDGRRVARLLRHPDTQVRRRAAWCLARLGGRRAYGALRVALGADAQAAVRLEAARGLAQDPSKRAFRALVAAAVGDASEQVRRVVSFALTARAGPKTDRLLARMAKGRAEAEAALALEQLGLRGTRAAIPIATAALLGGRTLVVRVAAAEALGRLADVGGYPRSGWGGREPAQRVADLKALAGVLHAETPLALAAAQAICGLTGAAEIERLRPIVTAEPPLAAPVLQVFAGQLLKIARARPLPEEWRPLVRSWLDLPVVNNRYLALGILRQIGQAEDLSRLGTLALADRDAAVRQAAREAAGAILRREHEAIAALIEQGRIPGGRLGWRWLRALELEGAPALGLLGALLACAGKLAPIDVYRLTAVLRRWLERQADLAVDIAGQPLKGGRLALLLKAQARAARRRALTAREEQWVLASLQHASAVVRRAAAGAARHVDPARGLKALVRTAQRDEDPEARALTRDQLTMWLRAPAGAGTP